MHPNKRFVLMHRSAALLVAGFLVACGAKDPQELVTAAREYLQKNDSAAAVIELKNALQQKPDYLEARVLLGKALLNSGDPVGAETELRKAREVNYLPDEVSPLLARAWLAQGQWRKITEAFDTSTLVSDAAKADLLTSLAVAWRAQGKLDNFRKRLDAALTLQPNYAPALVERARQKAADRQFNEALQELDGILAREPSNAMALKLKGDVLQHGLRRRDEALMAYQAAVEASPKFLDAHSGLIRLLMAMEKPQEAASALDKLVSVAPGRPVTLYLQAQLAYAGQDHKTAIERVRQLVKLTPDSPTANEMAGVVELQSGSLMQAQAFLGKALKADPTLRVARRAMVLAHLRAGQIDQAIAALPEGLDKPDADPAMLSVAGRAYMAKGDFQQAQSLFRRASDADPKDPAKRTSLAMSQFRSGQTDLALSELTGIAAQDKGVVADMALINAHIQRKDFDKALSAIGELEKKLAQDPMPRHLRGVVHTLRNDRDEARKAFESALSLDKTYLAAIAGLASLDLAEKKPAAAVQRLDSLTKDQPDNAQAWMALADARRSTGAPNADVTAALEKAVQVAPTEIRPRVMLVDQHLKQRDEKAALAVAQDAVIALPESPEIVAALGRAQSAAGENHQALATFHKLVTLMPGSPLPYLLMASAQLSTNDSKAAMQSLNKALAVQPDFLPAQRALAELAVASQQKDQALAVSKSVQKQRPDQAVGFTLEGDIQAAFKQWDAAAVAYRSSLRLSAMSDTAIKLHSVLVGAGKQVEADRWVLEWDKAHPKDLSMPMYLGDRAIAAGQLPVAVRHYERVIAQQPSNALALNNLAWVAGQQGRADAVALAEKANAAAPNQPAYMDTLAMLLSAKGEHGKAVELQKKVLSIKPDVPLFKLNMAKIYIQAGDKRAAQPLLEQLVVLGDRFSGQAEVQSLIKLSQ